MLSAGVLPLSAARPLVCLRSAGCRSRAVLILSSCLHVSHAHVTDLLREIRHTWSL